MEEGKMALEQGINEDIIYELEIHSHAIAETER